MLITDSQFNRSMGLGNKLFSWARAYCATQILGAIQIQPKWFALRNAAILRGGIDYFNVLGTLFLYNNFKSDPSAISRLYIEMQSRLGMLKIQKHYLSDLSDLKAYTFSDRDWIIFRADQAHHFSDLFQYRNSIKKKLQELSKNTDYLKYLVEPFIAIHYRSGNDFKAHTARDPQAKTDLQWFTHAVDWARHKYGNLPVHVVSDGDTHHLLHMIKGLTGCQIHRSGTAIQDLLFLSKAKVLLASGNSSFSAWSSFLSGADSFSSKATPLDKWRINANNPNQIIGIIE